MSAKQAPQTIVDPSTPTSSAGLSTAKTRDVHIVTMSKGGVGKTLISWNLVQYLRDRENGSDVVCVDLDSMNHSLAEWGTLGVRPVDLLTGEDAVFNGSAMDQLADEMITGSASYVLDNGASGFVALTRYFCDNELPALLHGFGARVVVHAVLAGGEATAQCLSGLNTLLTAFAKAPHVRFVLWLNEHAGVFALDGIVFENMAIYKQMMSSEQILGVVRLNALKKAFLDDFERMRAEKLTYKDALASPKFYIMNKNRLSLIQRGIWDQLNALGFGE